MIALVKVDPPCTTAANPQKNSRYSSYVASLTEKAAATKHVPIVWCRTRSGREKSLLFGPPETRRRGRLLEYAPATALMAESPPTVNVTTTTVGAIELVAPSGGALG